MANPKCTLPEAEREQVFRWFDGQLTQEQEDRVRDLFPQYLFFRMAYDDTGLDEPEPGTRLCFCTACREAFPAVRGNYARGKLHNEKCNCPNCEREVEGKAVYKFRYEMRSLESWIKTAVAWPAPDGGLLIEAADCRRRFNWDDLAGEISWFPKARYYFRPGAAMGWRQIVEAWGFDQWEYKVSWQPMKTISDPFNPNMLGWRPYYGDYSVIGLGDALEHSALQYCQILPFYEYQYAALLNEQVPARWIVKYLGWYTQLPQMEFAVKMGFEQAVSDLIKRGTKNAELINWKARTPAGFLRMDKRDAKVFVKAEMTFADLKAWKKTMPTGSFFDYYMTLVEMVNGPDNLQKVSACAEKAGVELGKAARYVARLMPRCRQYALPVSHIIQTWKDYLDMAELSHYDLTEPTVAMPRDLRARHDALCETRKELARLDEMKKYGKRRRMLEQKYSFTLGGMRILIPDSAEEIIREGQTLHHCVAGYAARHISGSTTILFLRKARTPMRSYLTIELYEERGQVKIRQIHGYRNERYNGLHGPNMRERFGWFLEPWLRWVNAGSKRDKEGRPILAGLEMSKEVINE